ncbi:SRPBCC family protein [Actinosynnema sp. NPDC020468]|uniref:SRPBCC family protein n=1 Tax=Actinosynnema sp. NPDC020468 TaxID=3154488 RepID=UPI00340689CF
MNETVTLRVRTSAPADRVRRAFASAEEVSTWLAEHATVSEGEFAFWGRHTPQGDAPRQTLEHRDDRSLRFGWEIGGERTTVSVEWVEEDGLTVVALSQSHFPGWLAAVGEEDVRGWLYTFWALSLTNLVDHVEGRPLTPKVDYVTADMSGSVLIAAPPAAVAASLVEPEVYERWFGAKIDIEAWVGGRVAMGGLENNPEPAKVLAYEPGRSMTVDWHGMVSTWELEDSAGGTRLTFVQSGFDEGTPPFSAWAGWLSGVGELRRFHEVPDWRPIWHRVEVPGLPDGMLAEERG